MEKVVSNASPPVGILYEMKIKMLGTNLYFGTTPTQDAGQLVTTSMMFSTIFSFGKSLPPSRLWLESCLGGSV